MKKFLFIGISLLMCLTMAAQKKTDLKVLYVGGTSDYSEYNKPLNPKDVTNRKKAFTQYLKKYFKNVTSIYGKEYNQNMSAHYDVTIFDGTPNKLSSKKIVTTEDNSQEFFIEKYLDDDFAYPAILIANMGELVGRRVGVKTDWYCLCLDADAHHLDTNHPIFKGPYKVNLTITDQPTPDDAFYYTYFTGPLSDKTPMWKVQTKGYMTDKGFRVGMVSRPWGFKDSPETEVISSGVCAKTIDAVAIGRHGNFFFWGFSASPKYMTDEAKQVFANAVVYTASLKGQKIIARKYNDRQTTKEYLKEVLYLTSKEAYQDRINKYNEINKANLTKKKELQERLDKGEKLTDNELSIFNMKPLTVEPYNEYIKKYMKQPYYDMFGMDTDKFHKYLIENEPYLYGGEGFYVLKVDEDCKAMGIANTDVKLLDKAITMLENKQDVDIAKRILDRYTLCTFKRPQEWRDWYNMYKDKMFFTQSGGWFFLINTLDPSVPSNDYMAKTIYSAAKKILNKATSDTDPVSIGAKVTLLPNGEQCLVVKMSIEAGYHIYEKVSNEDPYIATTIKLNLPDGVTKYQEVKPASIRFNDNGTYIYEDEAVFAFPLNTSKQGVIKVTCEYQCCNSQICLPPTIKEVEVKTLTESLR